VPVSTTTDRQSIRKKEGQHPTAILCNGGFNGKFKRSFSNQHLWWVDSFVLRNPPLRQAANRCQQTDGTLPISLTLYFINKFSLTL